MNAHPDRDATTSGSESTRHLVLTVACCLVPIAAIIALGVSGLASSALFTLALVLVCLPMMLIMMGGHEHTSTARARESTPQDDSSHPPRGTAVIESHGH
jgi:hypothetical protein